MGKRLKGALLPLLCMVLPVLAAAHHPHASAQDGANWVSNTAPTLAKIVELPHNTSPSTNNTSCSTYTYIAPSQPAKTVCTFGSSLGTLTQDGQLQTGPTSFVPISGLARSDRFIPSPDPSIAVLATPRAVNGNDIGIYKSLSKADLVYNPPYLGSSYYSVSKAPDTILDNPVTGASLQINAGSVAFSANGQWMVAHMPFIGLVRINMDDLSTQLFAGPIEPSGYTDGNPTVAMAVSNDGRYVAANTDVFSNNRLMVYDLSTCTDQLNVNSHPHYCSGKDVWNGNVNDGITSANPALHLRLPSHLQFTADDSLIFYARYNVVSNSNYQVASFVATAPGGTSHMLGLLGMGDSYISGQGAFVYRSNSDTGVDQCHVSESAYPFILGVKYFSSYNSIACSGARTFNVTGKDQHYKGQNADKIEEDNRTEADLGNIFANFLPGYIYQQEFAAKYKPEAVLLSVGGDDIGFADIVKQCVDPRNADTCYSTYEDRAELVNQIDGIYGKLVQTYQTIRQQSGGARLYVVGYPQVAQPGGDCGDNVHLNAAELGFASQLITYLDSVVEQAASTAGVLYVDTQSAFDGHKLCEAGAPAMNGLTAQHILSKTPVAPESYHPTQLGYQLLADTIASATANLTAAMPEPTAYSAPVFNPALPILADAPMAGRPIKWVTHDDSIAGDFVLRGDTQQVTVNGREVQLQPGSSYQIVLHSTPVTLAEGAADDDGNISVLVQIPADIDPGFHVLHVYATDMAGDQVDLQKVVYVSDGSEFQTTDKTDTDAPSNDKTVPDTSPATGSDAEAADASAPNDNSGIVAAPLATAIGGAGSQAVGMQTAADQVAITGDNVALDQTAGVAGTGLVLGEATGTSHDYTRPIELEASQNNPKANNNFRQSGRPKTSALLALGVCMVMMLVVALLYRSVRR